MFIIGNDGPSIFQIYDYDYIKYISIHGHFILKIQFCRLWHVFGIFANDRIPSIGDTSCCIEKE